MSFKKSILLLGIVLASCSEDEEEPGTTPSSGGSSAGSANDIGGSDDGQPRTIAGSTGFGGSGGSITAGSAGVTAGTGGAGGDTAISRRRVFVTSQTSTANLGGVDGAHQRCQQAADAQKLGGTWKAWISAGARSPSTEFVHSTVPYQLLNGEIIAKNWEELVGGELAHQIDVTEKREVLGNVEEVWTGTNSEGTLDAEETDFPGEPSCLGWTSESGLLPYATIGLTYWTDKRWTDVYLQFCNRTNPRLYCFEQ